MPILDDEHLGPGRGLEQEPALDVTRRPHAVYRMYDPDGRLLYIGCTSDLGRRLREHLRQRLEEVATITLEWHPNLTAGRAAESRALATENPRDNARAEPDPEAIEQYNRPVESTG